MVERTASSRLARGDVGPPVLRGRRVMHLTTVDVSLRYLLLPQLTAVIEREGAVIGVSAPGPFVSELEAAGIRHVALRSSTRSMNLLADVRSAIELWRIVRRERPDVLHTHNPKPGVYGRIVGRLAGVPVVVNTVHGLYASEHDHRRKRAVVYALEAIAARFSHAELVQNPEDLDLLRRTRVVPARKLTYLGNGVDLDRFDRARIAIGTRDAVRAELGVAADDVVIGIVGRLVAEKGHPELFDAFATLGPGHVLVVVGPDDPEKSDALDRDLIERARAAGVRFLGMRDDVDRLYSAMDVFVLPSHREGFPRAAMEAAAMGLPIVATDIRGCRQVVRDGDNGILVPPRDPVRLAAALRRLCDDRVLRRRMGESSARRARAEFDERAIVATVLDTYERLLAARMDRPGRRFPHSPRHTLRRPLKRALDLAIAGAALLVLAPVLGVVALAVLLRHGRPILFVQQRPGRDGVLFRLYKFRTMRNATDADGRPLPDDERLTTLGRVLRATSLDELPELVNVLRGDMSIVGPRPLLPEYLPHYTARQARRHEVRPGLTGLAQINGRNATTWDERLDTDVWYVDNWTLGLDLRIMLRTVPRVLGAAGIRHDDHATMPRFDEVTSNGSRPQ
jgi:lipopolysaccharide/colanic/teichoic acid biosynthesis glycosyltransferase/glycosyltransferase involved in cell wall biosynthesis